MFDKRDTQPRSHCRRSAFHFWGFVAFVSEHLFAININITSKEGTGTERTHSRQTNLWSSRTSSRTRRVRVSASSCLLWVETRCTAPKRVNETTTTKGFEFESSAAAERCRSTSVVQWIRRNWASEKLFTGKSSFFYSCLSCSDGTLSLVIRL